MNVVFVFAGLLEYKGRLLKQISTLQNAGHECILIHGQKEDIPPDYSNYPFEVLAFRLIRHPNKIRNFFNHLRFNFQAANEIKNLAPDAVVCVELYGALSGALVRRNNINLHYIYDNNELFMEMGMKKLRKAFWQPIHAWIFKKADVVIHAEEQRLLFCQQHYHSSAKHLLLENLPKIDLSLIPKRGEDSAPLRVVYIGALIPSRHCEEIILAFSGVAQEIASCDMIGFGEPDYESYLRQLIKKHKLSHVRILPPIKHSIMYETLQQYDVGLAFYSQFSLNQYYCAPNKIYDYIVCGLPVISNDYPGLIKVLEENRIGVCVKEVTAESIRAAIYGIISDRLSANISEEIKKRYSWQFQEANYCGIFE